MSDAFISYSHHNRDFAARLRSGLVEAGKAVWIDESDIPLGSRWSEELRRAIEDAATFIFVISPDAADSEECKRELSYAVDLHKRIIAVNYLATPHHALPVAIQDIQFVPARGTFEGESTSAPSDAFTVSLRLLIDTMDTDIEAAREHTEWGRKALEWDKKARDRSLLLSGGELRAAEEWLVRSTSMKPEPTELQKTFVLTSRRKSSRRQRTVSAAVSVALIVALVLSAVALIQRSHAVKEERLDLAGELSSESTNILPTNAGLARLLAIEAYHLSPSETTRDAMIGAANVPLRAILGQNRASLVAFSPNDRLLATASGQNIRLIDPTSYSDVGPMLHDPGGEITAIAFNRRDSTLVAGDLNGFITVWNTRTDKQIGERMRDGNYADVGITGLAVSPDGTTIVSGDDSGEIYFWNAARHVSLGAFNVGSLVDALSYSPDGSALGIAGSGLEIWNVAADSEAGTSFGRGGLESGQVSGLIETSIAFSPDGKTLLAGDSGGEVTRWDTGTHAEIGAPLGDGSVVHSVVYSPDGTTFAAGDEEGRIATWDAKTGQEVGQPFAPGSAVSSIAFNAKGDRLAAASGVVSLWNPLDTTGINRTLNTDDGSAVQGVAFSPSGRTLAIGDAGNQVTLWNTSTGVESGQPLSGSSGTSSVAFGPNGKTLWATGGAEILMWDLTAGSSTPTEFDSLDNSDSYGDISFNRSGTRMASVALYGRVQLFRIMRQYPRVPQRTYLGHPLKISHADFLSVAFSPDGKSIVASGRGQVATWSSAAPHLTGRILRASHRVTGRSVAFDPSGSSLATDFGSDVALVNPESGATQGALFSDSDNDNVTSIAFSRNGQLLAAAYSDGQIAVWNVASHAETVQLELGGSANSLSFDPDGTQLAVGDTSGATFLVPTRYLGADFTDVADELCSEVRSNLTASQWSHYVPSQPYQRVCSNLK